MLPIKDYFVQCNYKLHIGASLVAQTAKNPAVVQETGVLILGSERSPGEGNVFLPEEVHGQRSQEGYGP